MMVEVTTLRAQDTPSSCIIKGHRFAFIDGDTGLFALLQRARETAITHLRWLNEARGPGMGCEFVDGVCTEKTLTIWCDREPTAVGRIHAKILAGIAIDLDG